MPALTAIIGSVLLYVAAHIVTRVLISLAVGVVVYEGLGAMVDGIEATIVGEFMMLPATLIAFASMLKLGVACKILLSGMSMKLLLQGLTEGNIIKMFMGIKTS